MTRRRRWFMFAVAAAVLGLVVTITLLLVVDVYLYGRYERSAGFNVWGYRGPSVGTRVASALVPAVIEMAAARKQS